MKIETVTHDKSIICEKILRALPQWFGIEAAILDYIKDVESMPMLAVKCESEIVGFLSLKLHNQYTAEVHVMGVLSPYHRKKIGRKLILAAEQFLCEKGYRFLSVKTLSESRPNKEYDRTRKFYLAVGFLLVEEFKTLWGEHNPCLLLIKNIDTPGKYITDCT